MKPRRTMRALNGGLMLTVALLASCGGGPSAEPTSTSAAGPPSSVTIQSFAFAPADLAVPVGTTVTWTNAEKGIAHTSTSDEDVWSSGLLNPGDTFSVTLDQPGTFTYLCTIHPFMKGTVTVEG